MTNPQSATVMSPDTNRDGWNRHRWRRQTTWWDTLEVPLPELREKNEHPRDWLVSVAPDPYEHDYVLYTDGSGCTFGWGAYAAVWEKIDLRDELRVPVSSGSAFGANYGASVNRNELTALLEGVWSILTERCLELRDRAIEDAKLSYIISTEGPLHQLVGADRVTILWYTDRENLANALLFDDKGEALAARTKDRDLWLRWSFMARHVCVTPLNVPRNVVGNQAMCDALAGAAREGLMSAREKIEDATRTLIPSTQWTTQVPQRAQF